MEQFRKYRIVMLVVIGGGMIIYGLFTHPERLLPKPVEKTQPITLKDL